MSARRQWPRMLGLLVTTDFRAAPWTAATLLATSVGAAAASVCYSLGFRLVIDGAIAHDGEQVTLGSVLVSALFVVSWLLAVLQGTLGTMLTDRVNLLLGQRIARLVAGLPTLTHFEHSPTLARIEQLTSNRRTLAGATRQVVRLLGQALRVVGTVILLATVYLPILVVPLLAVAPAWSDRWAARLQQRFDDELAEDRRMLSDLFSLATEAGSARELRTYGVGEALIDRHDALAERVRRRSVRAALLSALVEGIGWVIFAGGVVGAIMLLVLRAAHGDVSPGSVVMAVSLIRRAQTQISRSTDTASSFNTAIAAARQLLWLEDRAAAAPSGSGRRIPQRLRDGITLEGVEFAYPGSERPVLGPLDLHLPAGRTVALIGENGAGKTTLVKLLCALYPPSAGRILIDGVDLAELAPLEWRQRLTATFQDFQRLNFVLAESVGLGDLPRVDDHDRVRAALAGAGAQGLEGQLPDGLATRVGNRFTGGRELSGGQWQRLALARGLMRETPLLTVLDEPTASLDPPTEAALFARYAAAARKLAARNGAITLLVSHRFSTAASADLIVLLDGGRMIEYGSHRELLDARGRYAELFELQARAYA